MLCRSVSVTRKKKSGSVPVYLNVYDLTPMNVYAYWFGLGIYHSGVEVHGVEYGFGAHEQSTTGIFEVEPKKCPGFAYRKSIAVGKTDMGPKEVRGFMEKLAEEYRGNKYHLITRNCNHFCNDVCLKLTQRPIPSWVNRLARLGIYAISPLIPYSLKRIFSISKKGFLCNCVLPASLNETKVRRVGGERKLPEAEKKRLRSRSGPLASSSSSKSDNHRRSKSTGNPNPAVSSSSSSSSSSAKTQRHQVPSSSSAAANSVVHDPKASNASVEK